MLKRKNEEDASSGHHNKNSSKRAALDVETSTGSISSFDDSMDESDARVNNLSPLPLLTPASNKSEKLVQEIQNIVTNGPKNDTYIHLRMLCQVKEAAVIVGKKGDMIHRLKEQTNTKINVSENKRGVQERVIHFRGRVEDVARAFSLVSKALSGEPEDKEMTDLDSRPINITLLIPHALIGFVIGKKGSVLRDIERHSSAYLKASSDSLPFSTDRTLNITGVFNAIYIAVFRTAMVLFQNKDQVKSKIIFYQPGNFGSNTGVFENALPQFGFYQSVPQRELKQMIQSYQVGSLSSQYPKMVYSNYNNTCSVALHQFPNPQLPKFQYDPMAKLHIPSGPPQFTNLHSPGNIQHSEYKPTEHTEQTEHMLLSPLSSMIRVAELRDNQQDIFIPTEFVGSIIGKNGRFIKSVNQASMCQVSVQDPVPGETERKVVIIGHIPGRKTALVLISRKLEEDLKSRYLKLKSLEISGDKNESLDDETTDELTKQFEKNSTIDSEKNSHIESECIETIKDTE